jgi:hypothetical protein
VRVCIDDDAAHARQIAKSLEMELPPRIWRIHTERTDQ